VEGRCLSYGGSIPYLPWLDALRSALGVTADESPETVAETLASWVERLCPQRVDVVYPYLARMLSLATAGKHLDMLDQLDGKQLRERTFAAVETVLRCSAQQEPLVLILEDLHWADSTSLALLEHVLPLIQQVGLLVVAVFRPHREHASWRLRETAAQQYPNQHLDLLLDPLAAPDSEALVASLLGAGGPPDEQARSSLEPLMGRVLERAEGNPFYVEEVIRSLIDRGAIAQDEATDRWAVTREVADIPIPDTLHGVLVARIDRLQEETRRVLQMASVIGRIFVYRVLAALVEQERRLNQQLLTLQREELIRERARMPEMAYVFKHELTREAAYNGVLKRDRRVFHRQVAQALEHLFPDRIEEQLGLLAHHWERAGDAEQATAHLLRAGDQARLAYAQQEAIDYYERARVLLEGIEGDNSRRWLTLEEGLGDVQAVLAEHDAALAHYGRARTLAAAIPASRERRAGLCRKTGMLYERKGRYDIAFQWLERGLRALDDDAALETARIRLAGAGIYSRQGQHHLALEWCQTGLEIARLRGGRRELAHGTYLLGTVHGHLGHSAEEIACARQSLALYEGIGDVVGQANALNNLGIAYWESGDWAAAARRFQRGLELEERLGNSHGMAKVTNNLGNVLLQQGDLDAAARAYQESLDLWEAIGFPVGVALSWSNLGKVCAERGEWHQALDYLQRSEGRFQEIESYHFLPEVYRRMATACLGLGQYEEAQQLAEGSLALAGELEMALERGISLRVLGQVHLALQAWEQAEEFLTASLAIAEGQGNRYRMGEALQSLGRLYLARARAGDSGAAGKAEPALQKARAIFEELGARRYLAQVETCLEESTRGKGP
jgi:tetratricopeptide (TPR) repeat protein